MSTYNAVYYVEVDSEDVAVNPIAIRPTMEKNLWWWEDTNPLRGRSFFVTKFQVSNDSATAPHEIALVTNKGHTVFLRYLTLSLYNEKVRKMCVGEPQFESDEALQKFYLETDFS